MEQIQNKYQDQRPNNKYTIIILSVNVYYMPQLKSKDYQTRFFIKKTQFHAIYKKYYTL